MASAYYLLQNYYAQETLLQQEVTNNDRLTQLRQRQYQAGMTGVDVPQQTKAQSDAAKQQILQLQSQIEQLKHQLAALSGQARMQCSICAR
ncbi:efflux transporter, outer membrane factor (OMF) lipoprotein, NodT family [Serratia rubidaea]|uniref:Efflux transporter, outer membrane factor (OMF) lipoprotein, NodT family n=1 Tax=Serratia rubidaea TaxID=61652 RepID=A0A3S4HYW5_SERRU|nr:efflux transporter, outer membrane factor (OMF) lipoprotein, NodT family [Serratia rubidaea]